MNGQRRISRRQFARSAVVWSVAGALTTMDFRLGTMGVRPPQLAQAPGGVDPSHHKVVATLPAGSGRGQVGIRNTPTAGPQALTIDSDGTLVVLDSLNRRVIYLDRSGSVRQHISVDTIFGRDLLLTRGGDMLILGVDEVVQAGPNGMTRRRLPIKKGLAGAVTGLARGTAGEIALVHEAADRVFVTERGQPVAPGSQGTGRYMPEGHTVEGSDVGFRASYSSRDPSRRSALIEGVTQGGSVQRFAVHVTHGVALVQVLGVDLHGNVYVVTDELLPAEFVLVDRTVRRYHADGTLGQVARVPMVGRHQPVARDTVLGPDGEVYSLVVLEDRALVLRLDFVDRLPALASNSGARPAASLREALSPERAEAAPLMASRSYAIDLAYNYWNYQWYCGPGNYATCTDPNYGSSTRPAYITGVNYYYEIPYQWGGYKSLAGFQAHRDAGKTCGDVNTSSCCARSCAGGVDCSGFIQNCWEQTATKYNDTGLTQFCTGTVGATQLYQADMWRLPNRHARLHDQYNGNVTGAYVYEAAAETNGGEGMAQLLDAN